MDADYTRKMMLRIGLQERRKREKTKEEIYGCSIYIGSHMGGWRDHVYGLEHSHPWT